MPQNISLKKEYTSQTENNTHDTSAGKPRLANLELLRCVAMLMVVILHYLGKGNLLMDLKSPQIPAAGWAAWLLESFCIVAVNVYMFISGYFLCTSSFKPSRLVGLMMQLWAYSVGIGLLGALTGVMEGTAVDTHFFLTLLFPVSMGHYWFMTAYLFLYLLLPFVGMAVRQMGRRQFQLALGLLLFAFCILKSILPVRFEMDGRGYDCLWYLCVFLTAAYVRRFGCPLLEKRGFGPALYAGCSLLLFLLTMSLRGLYLKTGSLETMIQFGMEYNHILPFLAAIGLFACFYRMKVGKRAAVLINRAAPYTLGVYLLHENLGLRYTWQNWLGAERAAKAMAAGGVGAAGTLVFCTVLAAVVVFACGIMIDVARERVFGLLHHILWKLKPYRWLAGQIERADAAFRAEAV